MQWGTRPINKTRQFLVQLKILNIIKNKTFHMTTVLCNENEHYKLEVPISILSGIVANKKKNNRVLSFFNLLLL